MTSTARFYPFARFAICGMISQYNTVGLPNGPRSLMFVMGKSLRLEGFDIANYLDLVLVHLGASDTIVVGRSRGAHDDEADRA